MEEIVAYDLEPDKNKACWFPFKKAYERRRIQPEHEEKQRVYVFEGQDDMFSKAFELSLSHNDGTRAPQIEATQFVPQHEHAVVDLTQLPSEMDDTETNSTFTDEDELLFGEREIARLADINANCMTKQFWVDEIVDAGSLSCADDIVSAGRSFTRLGRSFSTFRSQNTSDDVSRNRSEHSEDFSLARIPTPMTPARIEIEYDFSKKNNSIKSTTDEISLQRGMCGAMKVREKLNGDAATHTAMSSISNSTYSMTTKKDPLHSQCSDSNKSPNLGSVTDSWKSGMTRKAALPTSSSRSIENHNFGTINGSTIEVVHPPAMEPIRNRMICGTMKTSRRRKEEKLSLNDERNIVTEKSRQESMNAVPIQRHEPTVPSIRSTKVSPSNSQWIGSSSLDSLWASNPAKNLYPKGCVVPNLPWVETSTIEDSSEPHFFVEVEASARQLKTVKDLDEIKAEEAAFPANAPRVVEAARTASLVDDDSAFMEPERLVDVLKRFAPKRSAAPKSLNHEAKLDKPKIATAFTPPRRTKNTPVSDSPPSKKYSSQTNATLHRNLSTKKDVSNAIAPFHRVNSQFSNAPRQELNPRSKSDENEASSTWPLERTRSRTFHVDVKNTSRSTEMVGEPAANTAKVWFSDISHSYDAPRNQSYGSSTTMTADRHHHSIVTRERSTESNHPDLTATINLTAEIDKDENGDFTHEFELARFPSFSTEDWKTASFEQLQPHRSNELNTVTDYPPTWSQGSRDHAIEPIFDADAQPSNLGSSRRTNVGQSSDKLQKASEYVEYAPSLDETLDHAVPFVAESHDEEESAGLDEIDHRGMRRTRSRTKETSEVCNKPDRGPAKIWIDDDESELNTEAFQRLSMDTDDDSIFSGLVERTPSEYSSNSRDREGPPQHIETVTEPVKIVEEDSAYSGNSIAHSETTSHTAADRSKRTKYSRADFSRASTGLSVLSRDEITAYTAAQSVFNEPFNCMDNWLD